MTRIAEAVTALLEGAPVSQVVEGTIEDLRKGHKGHFFDPDTMKFFKSRVHGTTYEGPGGTHFVTSEQTPSWGGGAGRRRYSVRRVDPETGSIRKAGEFLGYKTRAQAHGAARAAAAKAPKPRPEQVGDASRVLEATQQSKRQYIIRHPHARDDETGEPLYWSNKIGWVDRKSATKFPHTKFNLPTIGHPATTPQPEWEPLGEARSTGSIPCYPCRGRGLQLLQPGEPCPACFGSGQVADDARKLKGVMECPDCGGESKRISGNDFRCLQCGVKHDSEGFVQR